MSYQLNQELGKNQQPAKVPDLPQEPLEEVQSASAAVEEVEQTETQEAAHENSQTKDEPKAPEKLSPAQESFRELRQKTQRMERERDEAVRKLQERETPQAPSPKEDDNYKAFVLGDDEIMEGKHGKQLLQTVQRLEQELRQYKQQSSALTDKQRLTQQFPDFEKVVNPDMLADLRIADPDAWEVLNNSSANLYSTGKMAYNAIKSAGLVSNDTQQFVQDRLIAHKNVNKPKPLNSINAQQGDSPMSRANGFANGLTDDLRKQLLKEMMDARNA